MFWWYLFIGIGCASLIGIALVYAIWDNISINCADGFEMVNPVWIYNHCEVNKFGAFMIALFFTILMPIPAVGYWFYKLCTVGRKK